MRDRKKKMANLMIAVGLCAAMLCGCGGNTEDKNARKTEEVQHIEETSEEGRNLTDAPQENEQTEDTSVDTSENTEKAAEMEDIAETEDADANASENTENAETAESTSAGSQEVSQTEASGEIPQEEGMLSKPSHSENTSGRDLIFIGDSRTVGMRDAVGDDSTWCCESGMGYAWMSSTAVPSIENQIGENTAIIILMGVNDVNQVTNYVNYINVKANEWAKLGAQTYYVSVGPVESDPYVTNRQIENFNALMEANLIGVNYIDIYSHLVSVGYSTVDGTHYPDSVSVEIYNYILENLEEPTEGIWG